MARANAIDFHYDLWSRSREQMLLLIVSATPVVIAGRQMTAIGATPK
jgi:hypothetical protein